MKNPGSARKNEYIIRLKRPHPKQLPIVESPFKRNIIRAGRRGGKTTGLSILAVNKFLSFRRILYAAPTIDQVGRFWTEVKNALAEPIEEGIFVKNETRHTIDLPGTETRIKAKTAWNADGLRGDYADVLILDEFQIMAEDAWEVVGVPMLLDNNGDAYLIYTPPSFHTASISKARDPMHAAKLFKEAEKDPARRWGTFHFGSHDNPHISRAALEEITKDMSSLAYRQEILAEDVDEVPGAMWTRKLIEEKRVKEAPDLTRILVGVDPPGGATECGIIVSGEGMCSCNGFPELHYFVLADNSLKASPERWGQRVSDSYAAFGADRVVGEKNFGGDMVESTIRAVDKEMRYQNVTASRGKAVRAEPVSAQYEKGRVHHVGHLPELEEEMCTWVPGISGNSPNRMDALVWTITELSRARQRWRPVDAD